MKSKYNTLQMQIGKNGLTDSVKQQLKNLFESQERIKVSILKSACRDKKEAEKLCIELKEYLGENYTYKLVGYVATFQKWKKQKILKK